MWVTTAGIYAMLVAQGVASPPRTPTGKWVVEHEPSLCGLTRSFGEGADKITLGVQPNGLGSDAFVFVISDDSGERQFKNGKARAAIDAATPIEVMFISVVAPKQDSRITRFLLQPEDYARLRVAERLTLPIDGKREVTLLPSGARAAFKALDTCQKAMFGRWGIEESMMEAIATPAQAVEPEYWISTDDYPKTALRENRDGIVGLLWTIETDGTVSNCRVIQSSGHSDLDNTPCRLLTKRGRYKPALDARGFPVRAAGMRRIHWMLPR